MDADTTDELRRLIAECQRECEAASEVALKALLQVQREAKRRRDTLRDLRGRLSVLEETLRLGRAR